MTIVSSVFSGKGQVIVGAVLTLVAAMGLARDGADRVR